MKKLLQLSMLCLGSLVYLSCENEPIEIREINELGESSELFQELKIITETATENEQVCLKFVYPLTIFDDDMTTPQVIENNAEFSEILANTGENQSIGMSYPIQHVTFDGRILNINSHNELKNAIDACPDVQLFKITNGCTDKNCILKVVSITENNTYDEALIDFYKPGYGIFYDQGNSYRTSWSKLYIENRLFINMELEDTESETAQHWSFNWRAKIVDENTIKISNETSSYLLIKTCDIENDCGYVEFKECDEDNNGVSEFLLNDHAKCIFEQKNIDNTGDQEIIFYNSLQDLHEDINALDAANPYRNQNNPEIIFCKILNHLDNTEQMTRIVLYATNCDDF